MKSRVITFAKFAALAIVLGFAGWALVKQFRAVRWDEVHFRVGLAAAAIVAMLGVNVMQLLMLRALLFAYGYRLPPRATIAAAWIPPLGKYVPGGVASIAGALYLQRQFGIPGAVTVSAAVMLDGLAVIVGLIMSTPLLLWAPVRSRMPTAWAWCALLIAAAVVALHPRVFASLLNWLLKKLKRTPLQQAPSVAKFMLPVAAAFGQWIFAGIGLWLMTRAVVDISPRLLPLFICTAALAMTASYLALFSPGGLGVRELLYLIVLGPVLGHPVAIIAVAMRIVQTLTELSLAGIGVAAIRRFNFTAEAQRAQSESISISSSASSAPPR